MLYRAHLVLGHAERAREVLRWGLREMPRSQKLKALAREEGLGGDLAAPEALAGAGAGEEKTCVRTRLLTEADDPVTAVKEHVRGVARSEVVALSSCVAGVMESRFQMAGAITPSWTARVMSRFVDQTDVPFGGMAPLANPLSMQVLVEEVGTVKVWLAAVRAGAVRLARPLAGGRFALRRVAVVAGVLGVAVVLVFLAFARHTAPSGMCIMCPGRACRQCLPPGPCK